MTQTIAHPDNPRTCSRRWAALGAGLLTLASLSQSTQAVASTDTIAVEDIMLPDIPLRNGVHADIHVRSYSANCEGPTLFAMHGLAHTAATWEPLVGEILSDQTFCGVLAMNLPGRGPTPEVRSSLPDNMVYGRLRLQDHRRALEGTLDALIANGYAVDAIVGHSQGALLIQMVQSQLDEEGESMHTMYGIDSAFLLAPVPPRQVDWQFTDSGDAIKAMFPLLRFDPLLGLIAEAAPEAWPELFFVDLQGNIAPDTPSAAVIESNGYAAPEPFVAGLQLFMKRPRITAGVFAADQGTTLQVVAFEQDSGILVSEVEATYAHLTQDTTLSGFSVLDGANSVHDMMLLEPEMIAEAMRPPDTLSLCEQVQATQPDGTVSCYKADEGYMWLWNGGTLGMSSCAVDPGCNEASEGRIGAVWGDTILVPDSATGDTCDYQGKRTYVCTRID